MKKATFAAGCFWGVEASFRQLSGVVDVVSGYTGGSKANPSYEQVCSGQTGHAEAVEITYDPLKINYQTLLNHFWEIHNPTSLNRQGPDIGSQYRSAIFYHDDNQRALAIQSRDALVKLGKYSEPIVTEIVAAAEFYPAEAYHQRYLEKHHRDMFS